MSLDIDVVVDLNFDSTRIVTGINETLCKCMYIFIFYLARSMFNTSIYINLNWYAFMYLFMVLTFKWLILLSERKNANSSVKFKFFFKYFGNLYTSVINYTFIENTNNNSKKVSCIGLPFVYWWNQTIRIEICHWSIWVWHLGRRTIKFVFRWHSKNILCVI